MTNNEQTNYQSLVKRAWILYSVATVVLIVVLVLFVASDMEEQFFFTIMPAAAAYVLRPSRRYMDRIITRFTGATRPDEES